MGDRSKALAYACNKTREMLSEVAGKARDVQSMSTGDELPDLASAVARMADLMFAFVTVVESHLTPEE